MPIIKIHRSWKDDVTENPNHHRLTRRDFIARGMTTGAMSLLLPKIIVGSMVSEAFAAPSCPPATGLSGGLAQLFLEGGPTVGAMFLSDMQAQVASTSANAASRYGINGANLQRIGPNMNVSTTSPFGATLLAGAPGYTQAEWMAVLSKVSGGGHAGQFNADDGAGSDTGLLGASAGWKPSKMGKDIRIGNNNALAPWAQGVSSSSVGGGSGLTPASLAKVFGLTPSNLTNTKTMANSATAASSLAGIFDSVFGLSARKAGGTVLTNASCGFIGDQALADPTYGATLFDPTKIAQLSGKITLSTLSTEEQAQLAAFYRSADGTGSGVIIEMGGRDYHGSSANTIYSADAEVGRAVVMFLAACDRAQAKGAMIILSNGQAIASGTQTPTNNTIGGNALGVTTLNGVVSPTASGDAGGSYNAGLIICYNPSGSGPQLKFTGNFDSTSGNVKIDTDISTSNDAVAGLYLTALNFLGMNYNGAAAAMQAHSIAANPSKIMLI